MLGIPKYVFRGYLESEDGVSIVVGGEFVVEGFIECQDMGLECFDEFSHFPRDGGKVYEGNSWCGEEDDFGEWILLTVEHAFMVTQVISKLCDGYFYPIENCYT